MILHLLPLHPFTLPCGFDDSFICSFQEQCLSAYCIPGADDLEMRKMDFLALLR